MHIENSCLTGVSRVARRNWGEGDGRGADHAVPAEVRVAGEPSRSAVTSPELTNVLVPLQRPYRGLCGEVGEDISEFERHVVKA